MNLRVSAVDACRNPYRVALDVTTKETLNQEGE
jgi:hypothetical protein